MTDARRSPIPPPPDALPGLWQRVFDLLAAAYACVLVYATHHPKPAELVGPDAPSDKTLHLIAYTLLGGAVAAAVASRGGWNWRSAATVFVALALFAAADEITQPLFGRFADIHDWAYDELGLVAGIGAVMVAALLLRPFFTPRVARRGESTAQ
jgi:VanZ family protein